MIRYKKLISLGSNCALAYTLRELSIREPSPFDWTNHFPIEEFLKLKYLHDTQSNNILNIGISECLSKYKNLWIHEDLNDEKTI